MSTPRALATLAVSAALGLCAAGPAQAALVPDPGPPARAEGPRVTASPAAPDPAPGAPAATEATAAMTHLEAFQRISDAYDGSRAAGTPGHEASARYVEERLAAAGYTPWRQSFSFTYEETLSSSLTYSVARRTTSAPHVPMAQSPATPEGGVSGVVVTPSGATTGCEADDWADVDAAGGVALVERGSCTFADKARVAAGAGAAALVVHNSVAGQLNGTLGGHPDDHIPAVGVTQQSGQALSELPADSVVTLVVDKVVEDRETFTVLAETSAASDGSVVMLGAHLDGGDVGPGLNDNGSGSAALLETAERLARSGETPEGVRFAWWGASELGNLGSGHYVDQLAAESPQDLSRISAYLDLDTVASPNHIVSVHGADAAPGTALREHFDATGQAWVEGSVPPDSDARVFDDAGVPSSGLSTGTSGTKTAHEGALFGGTVGLPYDPNHDTVADDIGNVDADVLRLTTVAVVQAVDSLTSGR